MTLQKIEFDHGGMAFHIAHSSAVHALPENQHCITYTIYYVTLHLFIALTFHLNLMDTEDEYFASWHESVDTIFQSALIDWNPPTATNFLTGQPQFKSINQRQHRWLF